jgi:hypothetical protein
MTELCGAVHPEDAAITCDKGRPCFVYHANAGAQQTWSGIPLPPSPVTSKATGSVKGRLALIARRAR